MKLAPLRARIPALATAAALALLFAAASLRYPGFFSARVVLNLFADNAVLGLVALGATFVIVGGGIDLSVGAVMALSSVVLAVLLEHAGWPAAIAVPAVLAGGALFGLAQGALVHALELPAFIVTLAGLFLARGVALWVHLEAMAIRDPLWRRLTEAALPLGGNLKLPLGGVLFVLAVLASALVLRQTRFGRDVYAIGGNPRAALLAGVPVAATRIGVYAISGLTAGLGGVAYALYGSAGSSTAGVGLELDAIAAAVVGGALLTGGVGGAVGTLLGVLIFGTIQMILIFEGTLAAGWARVAVGVLLLAFVALQRGLRRN